LFVGDILLDPQHIWAMFASDPIAFITIVGFLIFKALLPRPITLTLTAVAVSVWWLHKRLAKEP
jgi:hypothetical protein